MLLRDGNGDFLLPGESIFKVDDQSARVKSELPAWLEASHGTLAFEHFYQRGRTSVTSAAKSGETGAMKGKELLGQIGAGNFAALRLSLSGLNFSTEPDFDFRMGFPGSVSAEGGCELVQLSGEDSAAIRTLSAAGTEELTPIPFSIFNEAPGSPNKRNLSVLLLPAGYVGAAGSTVKKAVFCVLADDQCLAHVDLTSTNFTTVPTVVPSWRVVCRGSAATSMYWVTSSLELRQH